MNNIGLRFKKIRLHFNFTQKEFAKELNIRQQYLSRYEKEQADIPNNVLLALHEMGIDLIWLITGKGEMLGDLLQIDNFSSEMKEIIILLKEFATPTILSDLKKKLLEIKNIHL